MDKMENTQASILPRKEPVQARSRERFERILEASIDLIVEKGIDSVAMSEIAALAKISIASLYQYFPDKSAIVATLAERYNADGRACVREVFDKVNAPADMIVAMHLMMESYYDFFCSVPGGQAVWQASQSDKRLQELDAKDMEFHAETISAAFQRILPNLTIAESLRLGRLFTGIIGTAVRSAISMDTREARLFLDECKNSVLTPSVEKAVLSASN